MRAPATAGNRAKYTYKAYNFWVFLGISAVFIKLLNYIDVFVCTTMYKFGLGLDLDTWTFQNRNFLTVSDAWGRSSDAKPALAVIRHLPP